MTYDEFHQLHVAAKDALNDLEGSDSFPGLGVHDRTYQLPPDCYGWPCTAILRISSLSKHAPSQVPLTVWTHRRHGEELKLDEMTAEQHLCIADIKRTTALWLKNQIADLPPSTCARWARTR